MIPEVVVSMLACARIGAPHNVVFGGFSAGSVKERMEVSKAKVLITVDGARRKGKTAPVKSTVDEVIGECHSLQHIVVVQATGIDCPMTEGRDVAYADLLAGVDAECPPEPLSAEHPLFILYSSGSTAKPKGILHTTGGYLTGVTYTNRLVFDLDPDNDIYWCAADVGWITGHSYIVYGPLSNGITSVLYEGAPDYPAKDIWWSVIEKYKVTILYTAPTAIRACMKWGLEHPAKHDLSSLRLLGSVGEPINPKAWLWYHKVIGGEQLPGRRHLVADRDRLDHDLAGPGPDGDQARARRRSRCPASPRELVSEDGEPLDEGTGLLVLTKPWPSMLRTLYGDDERFVADVLLAVQQGDLRRRRLGPGRPGRLLLDHRAHRRRDQRVGSPAVDGRGRVGAGLARVGGRGRRGRAGRRGHRAGDRRVRDARRRPRGRRRRHRRAAGTRREEDRQAGPAEADHLDRRPAEDPVRQDHAPAAPGHRRGPRAR